ncbi:MAG: FHA domain-containing protein, partial [Faecousia sp.]
GRLVTSERYAPAEDEWQPKMPPETEGDTTLLSSKSGRLAAMQAMPFEERQPTNDTEDTTLLSAERAVGANAPKRQPEPMVALLRCNTGERIPIRGGSLVLGKEQSGACYAIAGNRSVSNRHAAVTLENGRCYLMDMFSTNGSFLEGTRLQPGVKTEVYNGALFSLGTEFFQVVIEG